MVGVHTPLRAVVENNVRRPTRPMSTATMSQRSQVPPPSSSASSRKRKASGGSGGGGGGAAPSAGQQPQGRRRRRQRFTDLSAAEQRARIERGKKLNNATFSGHNYKRINATGSRLHGNCNNIFGDENHCYGNGLIVHGNNNILYGRNNKAFGNGNTFLTADGRPLDSPESGASVAAAAAQAEESSEAEEYPEWIVEIIEADTNSTARRLAATHAHKFGGRNTLDRLVRSLRSAAAQAPFAVAQADIGATEAEVLERIKPQEGQPPDKNPWKVYLPDLTGSSAPPDPEETVCIMCYTNRKDTLFMPCRHLNSCRDCAKKLIDPNSPERRPKCPECRKPIEFATIVY